MRQGQTRKVSKRQVQELLQTPGSEPEPAFSDTVGAEAHRLADGRILLVHDNGTGTLCDREALLASQRRPPATLQHILTNLLPDARHFAEQVPALVNRLQQLLHLRRAELDGTEDSLALVDRAVAQHFPSWGQRDAALFAALVSYVGEVIRGREPFSRWEVRRGWDGECWEPWVRTRAGVGYAPFELVYGELFGEPKEFWSLFHAVHLAAGVEMPAPEEAEPSRWPGPVPR
jgi:hypothetical protein